ncbi:MAG TPA: YlxM family DNA-binding protein [Clostridiales bacterium]|jgi:predicted DNA-binding protein YlxM (UPF0122 family)|nr:YlxM family DNA-binding protein [Clostridiales bacterium]
MSDKTLKMTMLLDFFGELLTEKQRSYFEMYYNEDLSLSEIAENEGISRQGVRDIIMRAENTLLQMEEKTGLLRRFEERREIIREMETELARLIQLCRGEARERAESLQKRLQDLKG